MQQAVYATDGYEQSVRTDARSRWPPTYVFSDGVALETPTVTGDVTDGYTITLKVPLSV